MDTTVRSTANSICDVPYKNSNSIYVVAQSWTPRYDHQPTASVLYHIKIAIILLLSLRRGHHGTINSQQHCAVPYKNSNYISVVAQTWTPRYDQQPPAFVLYHIKIAIIFLLSLRCGHHGTINRQQHLCCTI